MWQLALVDDVHIVTLADPYCTIMLSVDFHGLLCNRREGRDNAKHIEVFDSANSLGSQLHPPKWTHKVTL